jgi:hypothetical protein
MKHYKKKGHKAVSPESPRIHMNVPYCLEFLCQLLLSSPRGAGGVAIFCWNACPLNWSTWKYTEWHPLPPWDWRWICVAERAYFNFETLVPKYAFEDFLVGTICWAGVGIVSRARNSLSKIIFAGGRSSPATDDWNRNSEGAGRVQGGLQSATVYILPSQGPIQMEILP